MPPPQSEQEALVRMGCDFEEVPDGMIVTYPAGAIRETIDEHEGRYAVFFTFQYERRQVADLTLEHRSRLDGLLYADTGRRGTTRLSWLREPPGVTSPKSVKQIVERLLFLRGLELPAVSPTLHQNRVLQLARKCSIYQTQPLLKFKAERRHALLVAHLFELSQDLTDQELDQFDKLLGELMRKGERSQKKHFHVNARKLNSHLTVLTKATEAFLLARAEGNDPVSKPKSQGCTQRWKPLREAQETWKRNGL